MQNCKIADFGMKLLITGGAGFIGSNFIRYILKNTHCDCLVNLDLLTYAGNLNNLKDIESDERYHFIKGDICDSSLLKEIFFKYGITTVVNFAAESHVDRSIANPEIFLITNIIGTQNLLDIAMKSWKIYPDDKYSKEYKQGVKFIQVSTDEVYGSLGKNGLFTETTPLEPNSPYSASKAGADLIVRAYNETYGIPVNITRCSNNYGPYQFPEKFIPLLINNCLNNKKLPVYGDGMQIRDWLYVEDHCSAIYTVLTKGISGEVYNIGGNNEKMNLDIVKIIIESFGISESMIEHIKDRPGHDRRYAIDNRKIISELGWKPAYEFDSAIKLTIEWYKNNIVWLSSIIDETYMTYYDSYYDKVID